MTFSQRAVEAAAVAAYEHEPIEKTDLTEIPWDDLTEGVRDRYRHKARSTLAAYHAALAVDGVALVPKEPTIAMLAAAEKAWLNDPLKRSSTLYRAMIAAASDGEERK